MRFLRLILTGLVALVVMIGGLLAALAILAAAFVTRLSGRRSVPRAHPGARPRPRRARVIRADDAIDDVSDTEGRAALTLLEHELDLVYSGKQLSDPVLDAFQQVVERYQIPKQYPSELLQGMQMDLSQKVYDSLAELHLYCYRVAGTVGLMMCHVLGVRNPVALRHAAHLGMAMQLTNICRDVVEDWHRGRLYLPQSLLSGLAPLLPRHRFPTEHKSAFARAVQKLLAEADRLYLSGDRGLSYLSARSAWAIAAARLVYSSIGGILQARGYDVTLGRAHVGATTKAWLVVRALYSSMLSLPKRLLTRAPEPPPIPLLRYPADVLPL